jgi:hypothetical protein
MRTPFLALCAIVVFTFTPSVRAADDPAQAVKAKELLAELAGFRKAKDAAGFQGKLSALVSLHNELENKGTKGKLQKELGAGLKTKGLDGAYLAIIGAIAELNDSKGAYKQLGKQLPNAKLEEITDVHKAALEATGKLAPDGALKALLELGEKAKCREAAIGAISALGNFKGSKKRVTVLEGLIKLVMRFMPPRGVQAGEETIKRWNELAPALFGALQQLTGQKIGDPDEWINLWRENKKKPDAIFVN